MEQNEQACGIVIPGLPEGVEIVRYGCPEPEDFTVQGATIKKGPYQFTGAMLIVKPAGGYFFEYCDMYGSYTPEKTILPTVLTFHFEVKTMLQRRMVLHMASDIPHLVDQSEAVLPVE